MVYLKPKNRFTPNPITFVVISFGLLIAVIVFHQYINQERKLVFSTHRSPVPEAVLREITTNANNISPYATYLKDIQSPLGFITQE